MFHFCILHASEILWAIPGHTHHNITLCDGGHNDTVLANRKKSQKL
jgi:hypothetical protein